MTLVLETGVGTEDDWCLETLTTWPPDETAVLFVSFVDPPADRLEAWRRRVDADPAAAAIVYARPGPTEIELGPGDDTYVTTVQDPSNLTRLGVEITRALDHLQADAPAAQIVVCIRSLSALLQYASVEQVFQFLQVLHDQFAQADAVVHAHLDAEAHDEQTVATLRWVFDHTRE